MPISKRRKRKNGKKVKGREGGTRLKVDPNKESSVTLQELINIVAYQDFKAGDYNPPEISDGVTATPAEIYSKVHTHDDTEIAPDVILRANAVVDIPGEIPVNLENSRGEKVGVGVASPIEGDPDHVSITITDPEILDMLRAPVGNFSIDKENDA